MQKTLENRPEIVDNQDASNEASGADARTSATALTTPRVEVAEMADPDSTPGKSPAFQFYPNDFLSDANVIVMSLQERGAYITLVCVCWQQGSLPSNIDQLARLCGVPTTAFRRFWPAVEPCFRLGSNGARLIHPRLERERRKQRAYRKTQSDKGKLGGRPKKLELVLEKATASETQSQVRPAVKAGERSSPSVFDLPSSDFRRETDQPAPTDEKPSPARVNAFMDTYRDLHEQYIGVAYLGNPNTDYTEACALVKAFDSGMLKALTVYWLNDGDKFASEGTRTIAKLRSRASKYAEELKAKKLA